MHQKSLFIFRRDLRLEDNLGLIRALAESKEVIPVFIFDTRQTDATANQYFSPRSFGFLCTSLRELDVALQGHGSRLYVFGGSPVDTIARLIGEGVDAVYVNKDYTPFSRKRDEDLEKTCEKEGVAFVACDDIALSPLEDIRTDMGKTYSVFTPFMHRAQSHMVPRPQTNTATHYFRGTLAHTVPIPDATDERGGRTNGLALITALKKIQNYAEERNLPAHAGTSRLSPHHKFGTVSIRETFHAANKVDIGEQFIAELYWRDFYLYIALHFPYVFGRAFLPWGDYIEWSNDEEEFDAWKEGRTGVPIVDAGMRQLRETGWMHNRVRMIVASYLTKNLLVDWRWGEQYFASQLVDYDPSSNNGGWQWSASVGADPRPIRIFNPYVQAKKFDSEALYIKKWVPELGDVPSAMLTDGKTHDFSSLAQYPEPLIDQKVSYRRAMEAYRDAKVAYRTRE